MLVLGQASLDDLAARAGRHFPVERFRPNLLLDGLDAYAEDGIDELAIGDVRLKLVKPCTRCIITTTDQETGARDGDEPLRTLRGYRHDARLQGITSRRMPSCWTASAHSCVSARRSIARCARSGHHYIGGSSAPPIFGKVRTHFTPR